MLLQTPFAWTPLALVTYGLSTVPSKSRTALRRSQISTPALLAKGTERRRVSPSDDTVT